MEHSNGTQPVQFPAGFHDRRAARQVLQPGRAREGRLGKVSRLPVSIRIVLESVLRNCDGNKVTEEHVRQLANWKPKADRTDEIPFVVARVVLQDFTGVPLLADLAAMRNVAARWARTRRRSSRWCRSTWWSTTRS
jgi:aconitase A